MLRTTPDALQLGLTAVVLRDAIAAVDVQPGDGAKALDAMCRAGAEVRDSAAALL